MLLPLTLSLFILSTIGANRLTQNYDNCVRLDTPSDFKFFWSIRGDWAYIAFEVKSSGYVATGIGTRGGYMFSSK